jgi:hypothetical protein
MEDRLMTDARPDGSGRRTQDGRPITVYRADEDAVPRRTTSRQLETPVVAGKSSAKPGRRARGVTAGRVAAAGIGVAAMLGLAAQMQVAGGTDAAATATAPAPAGPAPSTGLLRWEQSVHQGPATDPQRYAAADTRKPIVLTPHTIVNTVGGGSTGGSSSAGYAPSYSAPAAAPVASSGGSAPH